jgi:hypothetical protein
MSNAPQIARLRDRAQHLRSVSNMIASSPAVSIYRLAGPETWVGPTAKACFDALVSLSGQLEVQRQVLCEIARSFDRQADDLQPRLPIRTTVS